MLFHECLYWSLTIICSSMMMCPSKRILSLHTGNTMHLCSLRSDVERLAFSVIWEMTRSAEVLNVTFTKSIIKSRAALTYEAAQNKIDESQDQDEVAVGLRLLMHVAKILRQGRCACATTSLMSRLSHPVSVHSCHKLIQAHVQLLPSRTSS
jgi:RNB domain